MSIAYPIPITRMRILALVSQPPGISPGQRFRIEQWSRRLADLGIDLIFRSFESARLHSLLELSGRIPSKAIATLACTIRRFQSVLDLSRFDAVYLFREALPFGPALIEGVLGRSGVPVIFDFDDAIFVRTKSQRHPAYSAFKFSRNAASACRLASHVIAGNQYLADFASKYCSNVTVVPTTIETDVFVPSAAVQRGDPPIIGWTGSFSTIQYLDWLAPVLRKLARLERFRLRVISSSDSYTLDGVEVESMAWRAESEVRDLLPVDIGIMPLPDDPWTRGKCGCKALQYMALRIPAVCSPVGVNPTIIRDGINGFLATTENEWISKLRILLHDDVLRKHVGSCARSTVEAHYSCAVHAPRVADVFRSVVCPSSRRLMAARA